MGVMRLTTCGSKLPGVEAPWGRFRGLAIARYSFDQIWCRLLRADVAGYGEGGTTWRLREVHLILQELSQRVLVNIDAARETNRRQLAGVDAGADLRLGEGSTLR